MSDYNLELIDIVDKSRVSQSDADLDSLQERLVEILRAMVGDLEGDRVTKDEFDHFSFTWQAVDTLVRDRYANIKAGML